MDMRLQRDRHIGQPACGRFVSRAFSAVGHRVTLAAGRQPGQVRYQSRFAEALQVKHRVVRLGLQRTLESAPLDPGGHREDGLAPAPQVAGDDAAQPRPEQRCQQRRKRWLHCPVDLRIGPRRQNVLNHRQGVYHVAQGRQLDDEDIHNPPAKGSSDQPGPRVRLRRPAGAAAPSGGRELHAMSDRGGTINAQLPQSWRPA